MDLIECAECIRYKPFGNGYGECRKQNLVTTVKDDDYCSQAVKKHFDFDDHEYSGLVDE